MNTIDDKLNYLVENGGGGSSNNIHIRQYSSITIGKNTNIKPSDNCKRIIFVSGHTYNINTFNIDIGIDNYIMKQNLDGEILDDGSVTLSCTYGDSVSVQLFIVYEE